MSPPRRSLLLGLVLAMLAACSGPTAKAEQQVVVGVGSTTEQRVLAGLAVAALDRAGVAAEVRTDLGGTVGLRREAARRNVHLFWDYTGAAWSLGLGEQAPPADPTESWERVSTADADHGLLWLQPSEANATLALFVPASDLPPRGESRGMSWLAGELSSGAQVLCADADFIARPGGLEALAREYAIDLSRLVTREAGEGQAIEAVAEGRCDAGLATATSGVARLAGLVPVADDLGVFPAFIVAPVARDDSPAAVPAVTEALNAVSEVLDTATLAGLNAQLESDPELAPESLGARYLDQALGPATDS